MQSLYHGTNESFPDSELEPGPDGLIHFHVNREVVGLRYERVVHARADIDVESLLQLQDSAMWIPDEIIWDLSTRGLVSELEFERAREDAGFASCTQALLWNVLVARGHWAFRYVNSYEFPGISVAVLDPDVLRYPDDGEHFGVSDEKLPEDYTGQSCYDDLSCLSSYCMSAIRNGELAHWPGLLEELEGAVRFYADVIGDERDASEGGEVVGDGEVVDNLDRVSDSEMVRMTMEYNSIDGPYILDALSLLRRWMYAGRPGGGGNVFSSEGVFAAESMLAGQVA